jgi:hypothetical protein
MRENKGGVKLKKTVRNQKQKFCKNLRLKDLIDLHTANVLYKNKMLADDSYNQLLVQTDTDS